MYTRVCARKGVVNVKEYAPPTTTVPLPVGNQHILTEQFSEHKHNYEYSRFSLSVAVLLYKVTTNTRLTNTEPLHLGNTVLGFRNPPVTAFLTADQYI